MGEKLTAGTTEKSVTVFDFRHHNLQKMGVNCEQEKGLEWSEVYYLLEKV